MKRLTTHALVALTLLAALPLTACGNPCTELADATCERAGETSPTCVALRERATKVSSVSKRDCKLALKAFSDLAPSQH